MTGEQVFVVDRAAFFGGDWPHGFQPIDATRAFLERAARLGRFVDRAEAERTPAWKQWIPYCVVRCGDWGADGDPSERGVLAVQRTRGGGEARLHGSWTIGLGGHIEPADEAGAGPAGSGGAGDDAESFFARALARELQEELTLPPGRALRPRLLGLINDDTTQVGRVHAGLAYCLDWSQPLRAAKAQVGVREVSKLRGGFTHLADLAELWQTPEQFETWSSILIEAGVLGAMGPTARGTQLRRGSAFGLVSHDSAEP